MITIRMPVSLSDKNTLEFLESAAIMFSHVGRATEMLNLRYDRVNNISLFSQLLLYKFINYSATKRCFAKPNFAANDYVGEELVKSGFWTLIQSHLKDKKEANNIFKRYKGLISAYQKHFFIAPLKLIRNDELRTKNVQDFLKQINSFYSYNTKAVSLVSTCLCEIYMNFWEHATEDFGTIMVAKGDRNRVEIMFADNGEGIVTNLSNAGYKGKKLLEQAIRRGITSKKGTDHMGWGLWLVSQLCLSNNGKLEIYSEGEALIIDKGRINSKECGFWKGTIIHVTLPITQPRLISDLRLPELKPSIKIKWS
jgi:hypothetical protein